MTGTSWLSIQDDSDRCEHIIGHPICFGSCHVALNSGPHTNRTYTRIVGALDVDLLVANQKRTGEIDLVISRGLYDHSRRGLPVCGWLAGNIWTKISRIDQTIPKLAQNLRFNSAIL